MANEIRRLLQQSMLRAGWGEERGCGQHEQCRGGAKKRDGDFRSDRPMHQKVRAAAQLGDAIRRLTRE